MGDEVRRTQKGNNNAYCHDSELTWFDWSLTEKNKDLFRFVKMLTKFRLQRDAAKDEFGMSLKKLLDQGLISWHGVKLNEPDWSLHSHSIAITIKSLSGKIAMHYMMNAYNKPLLFELPSPNGQKEMRWRRWIDTFLPSPDDINDWKNAPQIADSTYLVSEHSMAILFAEIPGE
jgi:glycogen operon protein